MQYKAHIPAGIAFAATANLFSGQPLDLLLLLGGAVGGALPDIDVSGDDNQGSAVQHLGSKAGAAMNKTVVLSPLARLTQPIGAVFDAIILGPVCRIWRLLATRLLGPAYMAVAKSGFGRFLHLDRDDPSSHRGGLTHSLLSLLIFSVPLYPLCMLLHVPQLWLGIMVGMVSHLVCDAFCKSGVKFLWPWVPNIGFRNEDGVKGKEGIKLLPARALMKTGKCPTRSELRSHRGKSDFAECRKYYLLEVGWQRVFQLLTVVVPVLVLLGVGPASGQIAFAGTTYDLAHKGETQALEALDNAVMPVSDSDPSVTSAEDVAKADSEGRGKRVDEHKGPTSLTLGDIDATELPAGIVKMPDESLWIPVLGQPVTAETINDPSLTLTDAERTRVLIAATAQRVGNGKAPNGLSDAIDEAKDTATELLGGAISGQSGTTNSGTNSGQAVTNGQGGSTDGTATSQSGGTTGNSGILVPDIDLTPQTSGDGMFGFQGLTPFTNM